MIVITEFIYEYFSFICLVLCVISAVISKYKAIALIILLNLSLFQLLKFFEISDYLGSKYFLMVMLIDTITILLCRKYKSSNFVILLLATAILINPIYFILHELSYNHLIVWEIYTNFIYIYYNAIMKTIIILLSLSIFKDGLLNGSFQRKHNTNNRLNPDSNIFHPRGMGSKRPLR